jgi:methylated-DNA-[protein]-cysteine S-methyltransferase
MIHASFTVHPSPVGEVLLVTTDEGLVTVHVLHGAGDESDLFAQLAQLTRALRTVPGRDDDDARDAARQLDEYFAGTRRAFDVPLDWRLIDGFARDALQAACEIPYARTAGYGEVAAMAGRDRAARAVGNACAHSPFSIIVPVHRVVHADGSLGGYGGRADVKRFLLDHERDTARAAGE